MTTKNRRLLRLLALFAAAGLFVYWVLDVTGVLAGSTVSYSGYDGSALVSIDGRTITVGGFSYPCFGTVAPVAQQDTARVALRLRWTIPVKHGTCNKAMALVQAMNVILDTPLGSRALIDFETGRAVPWFDERRILHLEQLPADYTSAPLALPWSGNRPEGGAVAGCVQSYRSPTGAILTLTQMLGPLASPLPPSGKLTTVQVRGHPGQADTRSITWSENGQTIRLEVYSAANPLGATPTIADLITIADHAK